MKNSKLKRSRRGAGKAIPRKKVNVIEGEPLIEDDLSSLNFKSEFGVSYALVGKKEMPNGDCHYEQAILSAAPENTQEQIDIAAARIQSLHYINTLEAYAFSC